MNKALKTLFLYNGLFVFAAGMLGPLYAVYAQRFKSNIFDISISWSFFLVSTTVCMFFMSKIGDRIKEKEYLLLAGYAIRCCVWLCFAFIQNIESLLILQIILGLGESLGTPAYDAMLAEHLDKKQHIADYSDWKIVENIATAIAVTLGGYIATRFGFQYLFFTMSFLSVIPFFGILAQDRKLL